jgi:hypothetical protein
VFVSRNAALGFESDLGPTRLGDHRLEQPVHRQSKILNPPEIKIARHFPVLQHLQEMVGSRFDQGQLPKTVEALVMNGTFPPLAVGSALERHKTLHDLLPRPGDQLGVAGRQVGPCNLDIDGRLALRFVPGLEEPHGLGFVAGAEALLLPSLLVFEIPDAAGAEEDPEFVGHVVAHRS